MNGTYELMIHGLQALFIFLGMLAGWHLIRYFNKKDKTDD